MRWTVVDFRALQVAQKKTVFLGMRLWASLAKLIHIRGIRGSALRVPLVSLAIWTFIRWLQMLTLDVNLVPKASLVQNLRSIAVQIVPLVRLGISARKPAIIIKPTALIALQAGTRTALLEFR